MLDPTPGTRASFRDEYHWMSKGTFDAFWTSYRILHRALADGRITQDEAESVMKLCSPEDGQKPNVTQFRRECYRFHDGPKPTDLTRHLRKAPGEHQEPARDIIPARVSKPLTKAEEAKARLRGQYPWMSDQTFAAYWKSLKLLRFLEMAQYITHDEAEQVRMGVPRSAVTGKPNMSAFFREVSDLEQQARKEFARRSQSIAPIAPLPEVTAPAVNGKRLVARSLDGRKLKLEWVPA